VSRDHRPPAYCRAPSGARQPGLRSRRLALMQHSDPGDQPIRARRWGDVPGFAGRANPQPSLKRSSRPAPSHVRRLDYVRYHAVAFSVPQSDIALDVVGRVIRDNRGNDAPDRGPSEDIPTLSEVERRHILQTLARCGYNRTHAAKLVSLFAAYETSPTITNRPTSLMSRCPRGCTTHRLTFDNRLIIFGLHPERT
jgi:hypothetical protein